MSTQIYRLAEITAKLQAYAEAHEAGLDIEAAHSDADNLLIEALRLTYNQDVFAASQIESLISAWAATPKWYA